MGALAEGDFIHQLAVITASGGTTVLTVASKSWIKIQGSTTETLELPNSLTMRAGREFVVVNESTGAVTVNLNGGSLLAEVAPGRQRIFRLFDNTTSAGTWNVADQIDAHGPLTLHATVGTVDSILNISANQITSNEGNTQSTPPIDDIINSWGPATIDFQTGTATGGVSVTGTGTITTDGGDFTRPNITVGQFTRLVFVYESASNNVNTTFSAAAATQNALTNAGTLFAALDGVPIGYIDLESTAAFDFKTPGAATDVIENSGITRFGSGSSAGAAGDTSFKLQSISTNVGKIKKGFLILDDGREFVTYDGVSNNVDLDFNLKTAVNSLGVTSPSASTTYYLYLDLAFAPSSSVTVGDPLRVAYQAQSGTSGVFTVLASTPENTDLSRYVPLSVLRTDGSSDYTEFEDLARRRHNSPAVNVSPLVATVLDGASVGTVGMVANEQQALSASDFPAGTATFYHLNGDSNDDSTNGINLTQNGSVTFVSKGFFGRESVLGINGTASTFLSSTNAHFNPGDTDFALGGWYISYGDVVGKHFFSQDFGGDRGFRALVPSSGTVRFQSHTAALAEIDLDVNFLIEDGVWNHFVFVHDSVANEMRILINGTTVGITTLADNRSVSSPDIHVGSAGTGADNWTGYIQDFFFVNGDALTEPEVNAIYSRRYKNNDQLAGGHILTNDSFPCTSLTSKIVYWNLADTSDGSGNGLTLTNVGSTPFTGYDIFGTSRIASFNGSSQTFQVKNTFFDIDGTEDFVIGGWLRHDDWPNAGSDMLTSISALGDGGILVFQIQASNSSQIVIQNGTSADDVTIDHDFVAGTWHHFVYVSDSTDGPRAYVYLDGVLVTTKQTPNFPSAGATPTLNIGSRSPTPSLHWDGNIQDFFFAKNVRFSAEDIFKLYSSRIDLTGAAASVRKEDQIWHVNGRREDNQIEYKLSDQFLLDNSKSAKVYVNFAGESGDCVDLRLHDGGLGATTVPVRKFDVTYTSTPPATIAHNLPDMPTAFSILHDDLATGRFIPLNAIDHVKADATNIYTSGFGLLTIDATHPLRIIASVGTAAISGSSSDSSGGFDLIVLDSSVTTTYTASHGQEVIVDSDTAATSIDLPGSPNVGDRVRVRDGSGSAATNNITVGRNGSLIESVASDYTLNLNRSGFDFVYMNSAEGWVVFDVDSISAKTSGNETITGIYTFDEETIHQQNATPSNPAAGYDKLYFKTGDTLHKLNSAGIEEQLASSSNVLTTDTSIGSRTVASGTTLTHPFLTIAAGETYTINGQIVSAVIITITATATLTIASGATGYIY